MKLNIINSSNQITTLDVEPTTSIIDLMTLLYKKNSELKAIAWYADGMAGKAIQLEVSNKTIGDYKIDESSILKLCPISSPKFPEELYCPLSMQVFLEPVLTDRTTVEKQLIEKWIEEKGTSPFHIRSLTKADLKPNELMKKKVNDFFNQHKNNPFINALREKQQYKLQEYTSHPLSHLQGPMELDNNDILAMGLPNQSEIRVKDNNYPASTQGAVWPGTINLNRSASRFFKSSHDINRELHLTITALQDYGVTEALIRENWQPGVSGTSWSAFCKFTLIYLITGQPNNLPFDLQTATLPLGQRLSPINALREITGLCHQRVGTLEKLYSYGVNGELLRTLHGKGNHISLSGHCYALEYLVREQGLSPINAIERVNEMAENETWNISRGNDNPSLEFINS